MKEWIEVAQNMIEWIETVDLGAKGDDDLMAHEYRKDRYRICKKCRYMLYI